MAAPLTAIVLTPEGASVRLPLPESQAGRQELRQTCLGGDVSYLSPAYHRLCEYDVWRRAAPDDLPPNLHGSRTIGLPPEYLPLSGPLLLWPRAAEGGGRSVEQERELALSCLLPPRAATELTTDPGRPRARTRTRTPHELMYLLHPDGRAERHYAADTHDRLRYLQQHLPGSVPVPLAGLGTHEVLVEVPEGGALNLPATALCASAFPLWGKVLLFPLSHRPSTSHEHSAFRALCGSSSDLARFSLTLTWEPQPWEDLPA